MIHKRPMRYVVTAQEMRALDEQTIHGLGLPGAVLMENAGRAVAQVVMRLTEEQNELGEPPEEPPQVAVVCGAGNNGGDGYVIARCLREAGVDAVIYLATQEDKISGDAKLHFDVYRKLGGPIEPMFDAASLAACAPAIENADFLVDAVFGTGLARPVEGHYAAVIDAMNRCRGQRVAVDIPSGLSADTGEVLGVALRAHHTVTMAFLKIGIASAPGFTYAGKVHVAEIGIPRAFAEAAGVGVGLIEDTDITSVLPTISSLDHKNRRGHVLAVAGSPGKRGAGRLVAWAALRTGAGLVTLASPWGHDEVSAPDPVMTALLDPDDGSGDLAERLRKLTEGKQALAIGPGMPVTPGGRELVLTALATLEIPVVIDADGLNHLVSHLDAVRAARCPVVMTPHPGEAARLLGRPASELQRDRIAAVRELAHQTGAVVVLKGARTVIGDGRGHGNGQGSATSIPVAINPTGSAALATAGSGDVLTGIIAALCAQGVDVGDAARAGVYLHGRAGELAGEALGTRSVTSADLAEFLLNALDPFEIELA